MPFRANYLLFSATEGENKLRGNSWNTGMVEEGAIGRDERLLVLVELCDWARLSRTRCRIFLGMMACLFPCNIVTVSFVQCATPSP